MNLSTLFAGSVIGGLIITFWSQIVSFLSRLRSFVIVEVNLSNFTVRQAIIYYLWKNFKRVKLGGDYTIGATDRFVLSKHLWRIIPYENVGESSILFLKGFKPIFLYRSKDSNNDSSFRFCYFRWFFNLDNLIKEAIIDFEKAKDFGLASSRFEIKKVFGLLKCSNITQNDAKPEFVDKPTENSAIIDFADRRLIGYHINDIVSQENYEGKNPFDIIALSDDILKEVENAAYWKKHHYWYITRNIPWKLGWLLYGKPGTGKTSLVKALGYYLNMPVFVFSLSTFDNKSFSVEWQKAKEQMPCIVLFEDFDTVFHGRENVNKNMSGTALTFDTILNCIDGIEDSNGIFTIITTNKPEFLDDALGKIDDKGIIITRPGRIDSILHLDVLNKDCRIKIAKRILIDFPELVDSIVSEGENETGAEFQKRCINIVQTKFWERKIKHEVKNEPIHNYYEFESVEKQREEQTWFEKRIRV